jgi:hypothetical protein
LEPILSDLLDKRNPRIGAIIFGFLIWFAAFLIPDPNAYLNVPWLHKWIHVYCSHALIWIHEDQANEGGCDPGPTSSYYMHHFQMLTRYPVYGIILNVIPYSYPAVAGFLVVAAIPERLWRRRVNGDLVLGVLILFLILFSTYYVIFLGDLMSNAIVPSSTLS